MSEENSLHSKPYGGTKIKTASPVEVAFIKTTTEFISWLEQGTKGE